MKRFTFVVLFFFPGTGEEWTRTVMVLGRNRAAAVSAVWDLPYVDGVR